MISFKTVSVIFNYTFRLSVLVGCFAGFIFQALEFVEFYYEYQTTVEIKVEPVDEIALPSVTFCYKSKMNFSHWCIIRPDDCLTNLTCTTDVIKWNHYINSLTIAEMKEAGIQLDKVLVQCSFVGFDDCDPIYKTYTTLYGNCFTFNSDWMPDSVVRNMSSTQTVVGGKKMHMYFYLYVDNNVTYPMTNDALIVLGSPDSVPDIINDAYFIEPGKIHTFSVSKSISNLLPPPYATNCTNYDKMGRTSLRAGLLIQETCFVECLANLTLKMCGCMYDDYPYLYDLPGPVRPCQQSMEEGVCKTNPLKSETVDARHYCEDLCRTPCRKVTYEVLHYREPLIVPNASDQKVTMQLFKSFLKKPISSESVRHNGIKVALFINNKELKTYQHYPRYQDVELFSYIGGYLGIWLGISLANVLEMIIDYTTKAKRWLLYLKGQSSKTILPIEQAVSTLDVKGK